jgi:Zn-dependent peptidase ImmA (M78 family)/DNA-binding XRE family transcriptional regulator
MARSAAKIPFNTEVLRWARERLRLDAFAAAERAHVRPEKIIDWEEGRSSPTVRQARELAAVYDRPFLEFLSPAIPVFPPLKSAPDFRSYPEKPGPGELTALEGVQEWAESQRLNALDLYEELGEQPPRFDDKLRSSLNEDPERAATNVRKCLNFPIERQTELKSDVRYTFPTILRKVIESAGVLVLKQSGLSKVRTRGISLYYDVLPIIVFGNESPGGQAFTLAHEFAHVVIGQSAISGDAPLVHKKGSLKRRVEGWCNAFAAAFLMPADVVRAHSLAPKSYLSEIGNDQLGALANRFAVSKHAMLVRLVALRLVSPEHYWRVKRPIFIKEEASYSGGGRPEYYGSRYRNALGDLYTGLVLEALSTGRIGVHSASEFMGIKNVRHLVDIRENFGR